MSLKTFLEAVSDTPLAFYVALDEQIRGSLEEFQNLTTLLDGLCGEQAPHSSNIKNALFHCHEVVSLVAGDRHQAGRRSGRGDSRFRHIRPTGSFRQPSIFTGWNWPGHSIDDSELAGVALFELAQGIPSRDHALMMLEAIAEFFRQTEPHSPIPYTLEQTVRWGRMPLPDLLAELIPDKTAREHYFRMVGIPVHAGLT